MNHVCYSFGFCNGSSGTTKDFRKTMSCVSAMIWRYIDNSASDCRYCGHASAGRVWEDVSVLVTAVLRSAGCGGTIARICGWSLMMVGRRIDLCVNTSGFQDHGRLVNCWNCRDCRITDLDRVCEQRFRDKESICNSRKQMVAIFSVCAWRKHVHVLHRKTNTSLGARYLNRAVLVQWCHASDGVVVKKLRISKGDPYSLGGYKSFGVHNVTYAKCMLHTIEKIPQRVDRVGRSQATCNAVCLLSSSPFGLGGPKCYPCSDKCTQCDEPIDNDASSIQIYPVWRVRPRKKFVEKIIRYSTNEKCRERSDKNDNARNIPMSFHAFPVSTFFRIVTRCWRCCASASLVREKAHFCIATPSCPLGVST